MASGVSGLGLFSLSFSSVEIGLSGGCVSCNDQYASTLPFSALLKLREMKVLIHKWQTTCIFLQLKQYKSVFYDLKD